MLRFGKKEIDAFAKVALSGQLFRYHEHGECTRFEERFGRMLGVPHVLLTSSGSTALTAALAALGIGPGDEVIVPAHTYMATALAVLAVGAIPIIVDVDESIMLDPIALENAVGPLTRAVIPVHMWGGVCDMDAIMRVAEQHRLLVHRGRLPVRGRRVSRADGGRHRACRRLQLQLLQEHDLRRRRRRGVARCAGRPTRRLHGGLLRLLLDGPPGGFPPLRLGGRARQRIGRRRAQRAAQSHCRHAEAAARDQGARIE